MENQMNHFLPSGKPAGMPAFYQELGAYIEHLRHTCPLEGRRLSIARISRMAGMSHTTYSHVKRALQRT